MPEPRSTARTKAAVILLVVVVAASAGYVVHRTFRQIEQLNARIDLLADTVQQRTEEADTARQRALDAERAAREAAAAQASAEEDAALARLEAAGADQRAADADQRAAGAGQRAAEADQRAAAAEQTSLQAQAAARQARAEAADVRRVAEVEMNRLTEALGRIADTRRTALGLVMSLDEGYLKFDFDRAELRPDSRELLSRIAGILYTAGDFAVTVKGHTDARGSDSYNRDLSERRAQAVADYLIAAGLSPDLFTVEGLGKSQLLDPGSTTEAHSRNRRVELGIVNARMVESPVPLPPD